MAAIVVNIAAIMKALLIPSHCQTYGTGQGHDAAQQMIEAKYRQGPGRPRDQGLYTTGCGSQQRPPGQGDPTLIGPKH